MKWSDYEAAWKRQESPTGVNADVVELRTSFETKRRKLAASLLLRDALEGFGGIAMAAVVVGMGWRAGTLTWPITVGAGLILAVSLVFVADFFRIRRLRARPDTTMLARLDAEIAELKHQRRLLVNIGRWYFLPYLAAIALIGDALARASQRNAPPGLLVNLFTTPATLIWIASFATVTGAAIFWAWRSNRRTATTRIDPRLLELEKLRRDLVGEQ